MATEIIKRSKILAEIRDEIRALSTLTFDSATYHEAVVNLKRNIRKNMELISSLIPNFKSAWHDIRYAFYINDIVQVSLFANLANTLDKLISDEIKRETQASNGGLSARIKSFSFEVSELMKGISDICPEDIAHLSPEISCTLSELSSQIDELLRVVDAI